MMKYMPWMTAAAVAGLLSHGAAWAQAAVRAEDRVQITEVVAAMAQAVDRDDYEAYVSHYLPDAVYSTNFAGDARGKAEILQWLNRMRGGISGKRHVVTNLVVQGQDNKATATGYLTVVERQSGTAVVATAFFTDQLERVDGRWLLRSHVVQVDPGMMQGQAAPAKK